MGKGIKNRGSQVHHVRRDDLLAKEAEKEIAVAEIEALPEIDAFTASGLKLSQKQRSQLRSYGN
jgi:hypothetical protein